jgi:hypothetical protein
MFFSYYCLVVATAEVTANTCFSTGAGAPSVADFLGPCPPPFSICPLMLQKCAFRYFWPVRLSWVERVKTDPFETFMPPPAAGRVAQEAVIRVRNFWSCWRTSSRQFVEQRLCIFEVGRVEAFGKPAVDRREQVAGLGAPPLLTAEPGEARGGTQFPELGLLLLGDA